MGSYRNGESLEEMLPEAFATVKNAARRLCGETISVCDHPILWEMVHYDAQLIGGMALHDRHIAEMATGEGKTLVSTCPLYLNRRPEWEKLSTCHGQRLLGLERFALDGSSFRIPRSYGRMHSEQHAILR